MFATNRFAHNLQLTPRRLMAILMLACGVGIVLPIVTIVSKPCPFMGSLFRYYGGYAAFNVLILLLLFYRRQQVLGWLTCCVEWLQQPTDVYARRVVFSSGLLLLVCYLTRAYVGFFLPGISGWTFEREESRMMVAMPELSQEYAETTAEELALVNRAIIPQNARYLTKSGFIAGKAMLLHYADGQVLPANQELSNFVFPHMVFGSMYGPPTTPKIFADVVKSTLKDRTAGRRFLLPASIAYPNHSPHMPLDYSGYPPADSLRQISLWSVVVSANPQGETKAVAAKREATVDARQ